MKISRLRGWSVGVEKSQQPGMDDEWRFIFTEQIPPTGDQIIYEMNRETRDALVRELTNGIVLAGGELPRL